MLVKDIKLKDIKTDYIENCRKGFANEDLLQSIQATGQQIPVGVVELSDGYYGLVYGFRRHAAMTDLGLDTISCKILEQASEKELLVINLQENVTRKNLSVIEEAYAIKRIVDAGGDLKEFGKKVGWSKTLMTQRLALLELNDDVQGYLQEDKITVRQARVVDEAPDEIRGLLLDEASKGYTINHLKEQIDLHSTLISDTEDQEFFDQLDSDGTEDLGLDEDELVEFIESDQIDTETCGNLIKGFLMDLGSKSITDASMFTEYSILIKSIDFDDMVIDDLNSLAEATSVLEDNLKTFGSYERRKHESK